MKLLNKTATFAIIALAALTLSCQKYEDGPLFSIYSKTERVTGNWRFGTVREDGVDKSEEYERQSLNMLRNGDVYWAQGWYDNPWDTYGPGGKWKFIDNKNQLEMHFFIGIREEFTLVWDITRLAYGDLQLRRYDGDKVIEWRMWKY